VGAWIETKIRGHGFLPTYRVRQNRGVKMAKNRLGPGGGKGRHTCRSQPLFKFHHHPCPDSNGCSVSCPKAIWL